MQRVEDSDSNKQIEQVKNSERFISNTEVNSSEEYEDNMLLKTLTSKIHRKVPASKKKPILCNNVVSDYIEFNKEDFIKVYEQDSQLK